MPCYYLLASAGIPTNDCFFKALLGQVWYVSTFLVWIILAAIEAGGRSHLLYDYLSNSGDKKNTGTSTFKKSNGTQSLKFFPQEDTLFAEGDMAVYPAHGVGVIEAIESQTVAGIEQPFYIMKILDNAMKIMIPTASSDNVGLRAIISKKEVENVIDILKDRETEIGNQTWNRRYREYMEKIKTGSIHEVAVVLRDLYLLSVDKDLSYGERKMKDTAKSLLITEISLARKVDESKTETMIENLFT